MYHTNVQRVFCEAVLLLAVCWPAVFVRAGESQWSSWYNSDSPVFGSGDDETVERISMVFGLPCPAQDIHAVQCRRRGGGNAGGEGTFDHRTVYGGDVLHVPCNTSGLLCRHKDQAPLFQSSASYSSVRRCADYEIRLRCYYGRDNNNNQTKPPATDTITSHGAFVALVAGGSVVVPLVVVLVVRLRKAKRARQQGSQENGGQDSAQTPPREGDGTPGEVVDAPPPYDLLFANSEPASAVVAEDPEQAVVDRRSSTDRLVGDGHVTRTGHVRQGAVNHAVDIGNPDALSTVTGTGMSGESSTQNPVSSSSGGPSAHSRTSRGTSTVSPSLAAVLSSDNRLRRVSSQSSASSTRALLTSAQSESDVTHRDPPPAYDWPGHAIPSHVTVVMPTARDDDDETVSDTASSDTSSEESSRNNSPPRSSSSSPSQHQSSSGRSPPRRFLGMHLSILDIMSAIYPDPNLTPTPPPTYDDALKILAAPVQPEVQVT